MTVEETLRQADAVAGERLYDVYALDSRNAPAPVAELGAPYRVRLWRPALFAPTAPGVRVVPYGLAWLAMHVAHVFRNRDLAVLIVEAEQGIVHRTVVFPAYGRFPFMGVDDLNLGETWTHPTHRGAGLATFAVRSSVARLKKAGRVFWYAHSKENVASRRVIERAGFPRVGTGRKVRWHGSNLFARIELEREIAS